MSVGARQLLDAIRGMDLPRKIKIMNVCGGHERSISHAGLRGVLPPQVELIPGPGCPVCICPEEDVYEAIQLALNEPLTLVAFGDMLRVPVNVPRSEPRSLEQAKAAGADIRPIATPMEAVRIALLNDPFIQIAAEEVEIANASLLDEATAALSFQNTTHGNMSFLLQISIPHDA